MDFSSFADVVQWVITNGYLFIFAAMVIEGPIVTAAAAFGATLGYLNLPAVFLLSFLGDMAGDIAYYSIGYWGRKGPIEKYGKRFGLTPARLERVTNLIKTHPIKTLAASKYIPLLSASGLIGAGLTHLPLRRFIFIDILITLPSTIFFVTTGYYFGLIFDSVMTYARRIEYAALAVLILGILFFLIYRWFSAYVSKKIAGNNDYS